MLSIRKIGASTGRVITICAIYTFQMLSRFVRTVATEPLLTPGSERYVEATKQYTASIYHPIPVVLNKGEGVYLWDTAGKKYIDFLAGFSGVNQGHCHPAIVQAMIDQSTRLTCPSRLFYTDQYCEMSELIN
jgi:ornithine--oxo-acid transaminase